MGFVPKLRTQLGKGPTSSVDCGPRTVQMGIARLRRSDQGVPSIQTLRIAMGTHGAQPTSIFDAERGVEHYQHDGKQFRYVKKFTIDAVKTAVKNGYAVQVCVDYGRWSELVQFNGSTSFIGGHSMLVFGQKKWNDGTVVWRVLDPLEDGRRPGIKDGRPRGVWRPRWKVIKAMQTFAGGPGRCYAGVFRGGKYD